MVDIPTPTHETLWHKDGLHNVASILATNSDDGMTPVCSLGRNSPPLSPHFSGNKGWDQIWRANFAPPWDSGDVQPALKELVQEKKFELPKDGQILVPGCGRGYDVAFFASLGRQVVGLDVSQKGVEAAHAYTKKFCSSSQGNLTLPL